MLSQTPEELKRIVKQCDKDIEVIKSWKDFHLKRKILLTSLSIFPQMFSIYCLGAFLGLTPVDYKCRRDFQYDILSLKDNEYNIYDKDARNEKYDELSLAWIILA